MPVATDADGGTDANPCPPQPPRAAPQATPAAAYPGASPAAVTRRQVPEPRPPGWGRRGRMAIAQPRRGRAAAAGEPPLHPAPYLSEAPQAGGCLREREPRRPPPLSPDAAAGSRLCYYSEEPRISAVAIETGCASKRHRRVAGGRREPGGVVG